ncbi:related to metalloprotease [Ustilago trichophora]|uniref:Related to metalloprotease n=1 Tax=Ustilago trichophora TaxID=86804 RepID=A0A5C3DVE0_9BASI|nr:related to metalloprotease [Ustilago trichophora]
MQPFRQLLSTISLALFVLQAHQSLYKGGQALARPVQNDAGAVEVLATQPRASVSDSDGQTRMDPEAVLKALQALANGIQTDGDAEGNKPVIVISHGDGGPVESKDKAEADGETSDDVKDKTSDKKDEKDHKDPEKVDDPKKSDAAAKKNSDSKDKDQNQRGTTPKKDPPKTKAVHNALQQPRTRFCAQPANTDRTVDDISQHLVKAERKRLAAIRQQRSSSSKSKATDPRSLTDAKLLAEQTKTVQVVWHVIHSGRAGNLSNTMIRDQIEVLNDDYKAYGFSFNLNTTNRVNNTQWYKNISPDTNLQTEMKSALRKGDEKTLNLYSVDFNNGLLGYATFPWNVKDNLKNDGVVFQYSTVPGGSETGYNLGKTATHEVGHWLGLYHVFQGGCEAPGDYVDDTPPQSVATNGCPVGQDSCRGGGVDSIHNYMDYSSDACLTEFTEGQAVRMAALSGQYRSL